MRLLLIAFAALAALLAGPAARADVPTTVGALLDGGGKQLKKAEILKLFAGATIEGTAMGSPGSTFRMEFMPDGSASGEGSPPGGPPTKIVGTWTANEQDQYCQDLKTALGNPIRGCFYYFALGNRLFAAPSSDRSAPVYERRLTPASAPATASEAVRPAAALGAWLIGDRFSLAGIVYGQGGPQDFIDNQLAGAKQVAGSVGVGLPPFPARGEEKAKNLAQMIRFLIKGDGAGVGLALGKKYEPRDAVLFELAVKSNLALILYAPGDDSGLSGVIRSRSESIGLPPELWNPVVAAMTDKKPDADIKHLIIKMHQDVAQYLSRR